LEKNCYNPIQLFFRSAFSSCPEVITILSIGLASSYAAKCFIRSLVESASNFIAFGQILLLPISHSSFLQKALRFRKKASKFILA
jgi:hypothetical protein